MSHYVEYVSCISSKIESVSSRKLKELNYTTTIAIDTGKVRLTKQIHDYPVTNGMYSKTIAVEYPSEKEEFRKPKPPPPIMAAEAGSKNNSRRKLASNEIRALDNCNGSEQSKEIETRRKELYTTRQYYCNVSSSASGGKSRSQASATCSAVRNANDDDAARCSAAGPNGHHHYYHRSNSGRSSASSSGGGAYPSGDKLTLKSNCDDVDELSGLPEGNVDSDEEDDDSCPSGDSLMELRDNLRECLDKESSERTDDDLHVLLDFMQHMPAFANLPMSARRELCLKMVFAVVEKAYTTVMRDGEQLDSWCVIVNGEVEVVTSHGARFEYHLGDSFGVEPRLEEQFHCGQMRTLVDDCQFVLVAQKDYVHILSKVPNNLKRQTDAAGEIVSETEKRTIDDKEGYVLMKGKPEKLLQALIDDKEMALDQFYVEDFLLMYRTFFNQPTEIFEKFLYWFNEHQLRDKVARLVLLWVNNHFNDFETDSQMMKLLEHFEQALEREGMTHHQQLLNIACSVKSRARTITYTRSNRDEILHFSILGGHEKNYGIYVSQVEAKSQVDKVGLKRGDQILEVNNNNFKHISHQKALELLRGSTHVSLVVKSNLLGFKEMLNAGDRNDDALIVPASVASSRHKSTGSNNKNHVAMNNNNINNQNNNNNNNTATRLNRIPVLKHTSSCTDARILSALNGSGTPLIQLKVSDKEVGRFGKFLQKIKNGNNFLSREEDQPDCENSQSFDVDSFKPFPLKHTRSNPDLSVHSVSGLNQYYQPVRSQCPEHVLKIYRSDQMFKYLTVYKETTAHNVVQLALQEFGMTTVDVSSLEWCLCEVSVTSEGVIRQKRLPDQMQNLAERIELNSRYYLKNNKSSEPLVADQLSHELLKESQTNLSHLNANILAVQLTLQDFSVFASIEPTEYVDNVFDLKQSKFGWRKLTHFEDLVNKEMWWVVTEVCMEKNLLKRSKLVKKFIKLARRCRDFKNFNSMFAIVSGLEKPAVRRLHATWDKVPTKYLKMLEDMQMMLDPSRNMFVYRNHLSKIAAPNPPVIPLFPVIRKDLYFINEHNPTWSDGLVNFNKLRTFSKEIRSIGQLASVPYELSSMFDLIGAGRMNDALLHMNTFEGGASIATMRKNQINRAPLPRKKLYEQALMVRQCKSYLQSLAIVDNETELDKLSLDCEAQINTGSLQSHGNRRPQPSPSMGNYTSIVINPDKARSVAGPKFGVESPQAVQKMLSLVDHSKVRAPPQVPRSMTSPATSPCPPLRINRFVHRHSSNGYGRLQGEPTVSAPKPVDLTAESSSVTTLLNTARMFNSGCSSREYSSHNGHKMTHACSSDSSDSGHCTVDNSSVGSQNSPFTEKRIIINYSSHPTSYDVSGHYACPTSQVTTNGVGYCSTNLARKNNKQKQFAYRTLMNGGETKPHSVRRTNSIPTDNERNAYFDSFDELSEQVSRV